MTNLLRNKLNRLVNLNVFSQSSDNLDFLNLFRKALIELSAIYSMIFDENDFCLHFMVEPAS